MRIYFGSQPNTSETEAGMIVPGISDKVYDYGIEFGEQDGTVEDIVIFDACGRILPVDFETLPQLIKALQYVIGSQNCIEEMESLLDEQICLIASDTETTLD